MTIRKLLLGVAVLFASLTIAGPAKAQTCNQSEWNLSTSASGSTAVLTIPGSNKSLTGCGNIVIDSVTMTLIDQSESCLAYTYITEGTSTIIWRDVTNTGTTTIPDQTSRTQPIPFPGYLFFNSANGGLVEFASHCANSGQMINVLGHYMP